MFSLILIVCFIFGILIGIPTAPYVSPPSPSTIIFVMSPFLFLYFFSENSLMNDIRYGYLAIALGIFSYWTYFQIQNMKLDS